MKRMNTLLLIDGNAIMHRAFHAIPLLNASDGTPTNMVYGFFLMLDTVLRARKPTHIAVCFDTPARTFRNELYTEYQAHRPSVPDSFIQQIPIIQSLLDTAQINRMQKDGFEADDIIGTLSQEAEKEKMLTEILTGDKDIFQLVTMHTTVLSPTRGISTLSRFTPEKVYAKLNVYPEQIPDYKALAGDPSDNYPGLPGVGPKTAASLLHQFRHIEDMYQNLNAVKNMTLRSKLITHKDTVFLTKKIATIVRTVDVPHDIPSLRCKPFPPQLHKQFLHYNLKSLLRRYFPAESFHKRESEPEKTQQLKKKPSSAQLDLFS